MQCPGEATDKCNNKTKPPVPPYGVRKGGCGEGLQLSPERYMKDSLEEIQANKHRRKKISLFITFLIRWIILFYIVLMQLTDVF